MEDVGAIPAAALTLCFAAFSFFPPLMPAKPYNSQSHFTILCTSHGGIVSTRRAAQSCPGCRRRRCF